MLHTFKNLLHILKRYKLASITNLIGLTLAFMLFILIRMHVNYEYGFDSQIANRERIFKMENLRDDGIWESNFSRPQMERFIASSPYIEAAAITNNFAYSSFRFGVAGSPDDDAITYLEKLERVTRGFTDVFHFDMLAGNANCLNQPDGALIPESIAQKLYGTTDVIGKPVYFTEFKDANQGFSLFGINFGYIYTVGGVYRDFPDNTRLANAVYTPILKTEMMDDWYTGPYYCYVLFSSPEVAFPVMEQYMAESADFLKNFGIDDMRLRPLTELYFGQQVRADAIPAGNKFRTNMLFFIAILVIVIALINYINLSVALAPVRTKSVTTQKVLGCSQNILRRSLVAESLVISSLAFFLAVILVLLLKDASVVTGMLGHSLNLSSNIMVLLWTALLAIGTGILAGVYPAWYITSFPPAMALNGSYSLTDKAKGARKVLISFQYVISITLIIGALFVSLQNKFIENVDLGFEKENVLEVRLSIGAALTKSDLYRDLLLEHPDIKDVAFNEFKFVSDDSKSSIGYNYQGEHFYMGWIGVSPNFPELMGLNIIAGRNFQPGDEQQNNNTAVCIINETAAQEIASRFADDEVGDITNLVGTSIRDNNEMVQIVGIFRDFHYESLYKEVSPFGFWVSARNQYRRFLPENYSYVKIAGGNPQPAIDHIRKVTNELTPGYPADIRFFDETLNQLYHKSHKQGLLVTLFSLMAVLLSLVGVFGLVIFESQGREKEIAIRKVFGATIQQILWMFNNSFLRVVLIGFIISVPLAYYGVSKWLQSFAYKTPLYMWVFVVALLVITLLTVITVTLQSYRTAIANPARKLSR